MAHRLYAPLSEQHKAQIEASRQGNQDVLTSKDRDPCPTRIIDDVGGAYSIGFLGSTVWNTCRGFRIYPGLIKAPGVLTAIAYRAPQTGGSFAIWGGLYALCDCLLTGGRRKEDPWNSIVAGAATGGVLACRQGPVSMAFGAAIGGTILALMEGFEIAISKFLTNQQKAAEQQMMEAEGLDPTAPPTAPPPLM